MTAKIIPFQYEARELRTVLVDDEPWFVAADVARILGYRAAPEMTRIIDAEDKGTQTLDTLGGPQSLTVITEPALYHVILQRQAGYVADAEARLTIKAFQRWITHDVIPAIRKTGTYGVAKQLPQDYATALRELASEVEAHELAKVRIRELEPPAKAWLALVDATGDYSVGDAAKMLSRDPCILIGQNTLFRWLDKHGWTYQRNGERHPYQDKVDAGLLTCKTNRPYWNSRLGEDVLPAPTIRVTAKGLHKLYAALGGTEPLVEATA